MKVLGLILGLLTTANVYSEGFDSSFVIQPNSQIKRDADNNNFTDLEFHLGYKNTDGHRFSLLSEFRHTPENETTNAQNIRLRHQFGLGEINDTVSFSSDFRLYFQGEESETKGFGELNLLMFAPSMMAATELSGGKLYFIFKPYLTKHFNNEKFSIETTDTESNLVPNIDLDVYNMFLVGLGVGNLTIEVYYGYQMNFNTVGKQVDDGYELAQEITYAFSKNFSILLGHTTSNALFDSTGRSNSINFSTPDGDRYWTNVTLSF